jgi:cold shock CspA family protein
MIRKGWVLSINKFNGVGVIVDENEQEISFLVEHPMEWPAEGEQVRFDIVLTALGLMATNIVPVSQKLLKDEHVWLVTTDLTEPL